MQKFASKSPHGGKWWAQFFKVSFLKIYNIGIFFYANKIIFLLFFTIFFLV